MPWYNRISLRTYIIFTVGVIALSAFTLLLMGRVPWCACGYIKFWHGTVMSSENSQHITDWYTFSHIIHGFIFYWIVRLIDRRRRWPFGLRLLLAIVAEVSWEILENSPLIINRYRTATASFDYFGDSIINSTGDVLAAVLGFVLASRLPVWVTVTLAIIMEVVVGYIIRDNLTLNVIMLLYPLEMIKRWQLGG